MPRDGFDSRELIDVRNTVRDAVDRLSRFQNEWMWRNGSYLSRLRDAEQSLRGALMNIQTAITEAGDVE